jgi:hypothetical protein
MFVAKYDAGGTLIDGTIDPITGGTVTDDEFGSRAQVTFPAGVLTDSTDVTITVFQDPPVVPTPGGFSAPGTLFVDIDLDPTPSFPLVPPGLTIVLPVEPPLAAGTPLSLYRVNPSTGDLEPALDVNEMPVTGSVDAPDGESATFQGIASLSTVVGLLPLSPQAQVEAIITTVDGLVAQGKLKWAYGRALTATLAAAARQLDRGRTVAAVVLLKAFVVEVKLLVRFGRLAAADGQPLIDAAEAVIAQLRE